MLFNAWDAGTAKAVASAGAKAIATSSWSVADANGFSDGEKIPLAVAIDNLRRIAGATELPVTADLESGYGDSPDAVANTVELAIGARVVGCNLEDSFPATGKLRATNEQVARIQSAREAAHRFDIHFFLNARTDVFFQEPPGRHDDLMLAEAVSRARAYARAGADGIFAPGLVDIALIARLAEASPIPLNIMVGDATPSLPALAEHGVARVSYGPTPYLMAMKGLAASARLALDSQS